VHVECHFSYFLHHFILGESSPHRESLFLGIEGG
jgi:hypothetical protein